MGIIEHEFYDRYEKYSSASHELRINIALIIPSGTTVKVKIQTISLEAKDQKWKVK